MKRKGELPVAVHFTERLQFELTTKGCQVPEDERARLQSLLAPLADAVEDFPAAALRIHVIHHPASGQYRVEGELKLPGRTLSAAEEDAYLDSAAGRCLGGLIRQAEAYADQPDREALEAAERRVALDRDVLAPDGGPLARAARSGDYRAFRAALAGYEEWLRKRVGRIVQRIPEAQARVGRGLLLGDVVEAVYLDAFERFARRPTAVRLSEWLEGLIEPCVRALLRNPDQEHEAASAARTVRQTPMG